MGSDCRLEKVIGSLAGCVEGVMVISRSLMDLECSRCCPTEEPLERLSNFERSLKCCSLRFKEIPSVGGGWSARPLRTI